MPELPEVETVVKTLRPFVINKRIGEVVLLRTDILLPEGFDFISHAKDQKVKSLNRRGKRIVFEIETGDHFYIHLGMTGRITIDDPETELAKHTHLVMTVDGKEIRFRDPRRFGGVWWLGKESPAGTMGPEPLSTSPAQLGKRLAKTTRAIKSALLDQTIIAGLGNIYVDESLFKAGLHPLLPANQLDAKQIADLNRSIKSVLRKALRHRGSTLRDYFDADGNPGGFQKLHSVYDRAGLECRTCKTKIERIVLGGRSTHFCPQCQKKKA